MKVKYSVFCLLFMLFASYDTLLAQNEKSELMIDRPLVLPKKQLEVNYMYRFGSLTNLWNEDGVKIKKSEVGYNASEHQNSLLISYGITQKLQVQALLANYSQKRFTESVVQKGISPILTMEDKVIKNQGMMDPEIKLTFSPIKSTSRFNFAIGGGISLPVFKHGEEQPKVDSAHRQGMVNIYRYYITKNNGSATIVYNIGLAAKYKFADSEGKGIGSKLCLRYYGDMYLSPDEVMKEEWQSVFNPDNPYGFGFAPYKTNRKEGVWQYHRLFLDYQPFKLTMFTLGYIHRNYQNGWHETNGQKISDPERSASSLYLGSQIQATPKLRIQEAINIPISGKNMASFVHFQLSFIYTIM